MNLANKQFKNLRTNEVIKVIDSFDNIAILEGKGKENVTNLLNPNLYTEYIDPSSFFNNQNSYNSLFDKIKNIPTEHIKDEAGKSEIVINADNSFKPTTNESAVVMYDPEEEKAELMKKYNIKSDESIQKQNEAFDKLLNPEKSQIEQPIKKTEANIQKQQPVQQIVVDDPITAMFRNVKRNVDFSINIDINNKIPRIDFIEMMEDSYDISIIDFLAEEFTNNLLKNPRIIKDIISSKIKQIVYGGNEVTKNTEKEKVIIEQKEVGKRVIKKTIPKIPTPPADRILKEGKTPKKPKKELNND
jgi:hypothetical protein